MPLDRLERWQTLLWLGVGVLILALLAVLAPILTPFLLAGIIAYICNPAVDRLEARGVPRLIGALLMMLLLSALLTALVLVLYPLVQKEIMAMADRVPVGIELFNREVAPWLLQRFGIEARFDAESTRDLVMENWDSAQAILQKVLDGLRLGGLALVGFLANLMLMPVVIFFLLRDWNVILLKLENAVPRPWYARAMRIFRDIDAVLAEFLRGQILVMLVLSIFYTVGLWLAGVESALALGVLTGLLVFIPYLGFATGFILSLLVAALQFQGFAPVIGVLIVYGVGQAVESFVLTPFLVGERIGLHPLAVIFALLAFGQLFGFFGVLLALPASAALLVGLREVRTEYLKSPFYRGKAPS